MTETLQGSKLDTGPDPELHFTAKKAQDIILAYYYFVKDNEALVGCTPSDAQELKHTALEEYLELKRFAERNDSEFVVSSCNDISDPLIVFRISDNERDVEQVRELKPGETFSGRLFDGDGPFLRIVDENIYKSPQPNTEYVYLCVGAKGPEFTIVDFIEQTTKWYTVDSTQEKPTFQPI